MILSEVYWTCNDFKATLDKFFHSTGVEVLDCRACDFLTASRWFDDNFDPGRAYNTVVAELGTKVTYIRCKRTMLVTPSTAFTSGIVALFWAILGSEEVELWPSRSDKWTVEFAKLLKETESGKGLTIHEDRTESAYSVMDRCEAVVVYGSDDTCSYFKDGCLDGQVFIGYGSKTSIAVHDKDEWDPEDSKKLALDLTTYNGLGCLNPTVVYVKDVEAAGDGLNETVIQIEKLYENNPPVHQLWSKFRDLVVWDDCVTEINGPLAYRLPAPMHTLPPTLGYGTFYVVQYEEREDIVKEWSAQPGVISSITLNTDNDSEEWVGLLKTLEPSRITQFGRAQLPPLSWSHDNMPNLLPLVKLVDIELPGF